MALRRRLFLGPHIRAVVARDDDGCAWLDVERRLDSKNVLERLEAMFVSRGTPECVRSDNGADLPAKAVRERIEVRHSLLSAAARCDGSPTRRELVLGWAEPAGFWVLFMRDELIEKDIGFSVEELDFYRAGRC
jgi:hypothetical protein